MYMCMYTHAHTHTHTHTHTQVSRMEAEQEELKQQVSEREAQIAGLQERLAYTADECARNAARQGEDNSALQDKYEKTYLDLQKAAKTNDRLSRINKNFQQHIQRTMMAGHGADEKSKAAAINASMAVQGAIKTMTDEHEKLRAQHRDALTLLGKYELSMSTLFDKIQAARDEPVGGEIISMLRRFVDMTQAKDNNFLEQQKKYWDSFTSFTYDDKTNALVQEGHGVLQE